MSSKIGKSLGVAIGAAFVGSLSLSQLAAASPAFQASDLAAGYMLAAAGEGKCGEGKCGIEKVDTDGDGRVSQAEFLARHPDEADHFPRMDANQDGFIDQAEIDAYHAGKHGEGKCGAEHKGKHEDKAAEGKCGEGKCGIEKVDADKDGRV